MTDERDEQPPPPVDGTSTTTAASPEEPTGSSGSGNETPTATLDENENDAHDNSLSGAPATPASASASPSTPLPQPRPHPNPPPQETTPSAHNKRPIAPTPPRWRFVNEAKKKAGYSTSDAGRAVDGKSAEELAAKYRPPSMAEDSRNGKKGQHGGEVGKLAIPSSFLGQLPQDSLELQRLQRESQRMKMEQERLLREIESVKGEKERLEEEARLARVEKERVEREALVEKEVLVARLAELERKEKENEEMEEKEKTSEHEISLTELKSDDGNENDFDEKAQLKKKISELEKNDDVTSDQEQTRETTELIVQSLQQKQTDIEAFYASAIERAEQIQRDLDAVVKKGEEQLAHDEPPQPTLQQPLEEQILQEQDLKSTFAEDGSRYPEGDDSVIYHVPTSIETKKENANGPGADEDKDGNDNKSKKRKYLLWGLLALILIGACIGAAVGIVTNQSNSNENDNSQLALRGSGPTTATTKVPSVSVDTAAPSNYPTLPSSSPNPTTISVITTTSSSSSTTTTTTTTTTTAATTTTYPPKSTSPNTTPTPTLPPYNILCRPGFNKNFEVHVTFDSHPEELSWRLLDACTLRVVEECEEGCYEDMLPYSQRGFQTCIPLWQEETGLEAGYVFIVMDGGGDGLCGDGGGCGSYEVTFGEEVVYESNGSFESEESFFLGVGIDNCPGGGGGNNTVSTINPTMATPNPPPTNPPTSIATIVTPNPTTLPSYPITCRPGIQSKFQLDITFDANPQEIFWVLLDACTLNVIEQCQRCYVDQEPNSQITFQTCLLSFNATTGLEAGYVFTIADSSGNGLCDGGICGSYDIMYGEEVVFESAGAFEDEQKVFLGSGLEYCPESAENDTVIISTNPTTAPPILPPTNPPTSLAPRVTPPPTTLPPSPVFCRPGLLTKFQLNITFDANPQEVFWVLLDACTLTVMERCQGCYVDEDPNSQITFQTCLPSFNETTGLEAGYVFTINDGGGNGLCADGVCGSYSIMYGEEVVFESDGIYEAQQRVFLGSGLTNCPGNVETDDGVVTIPTNPPVQGQEVTSTQRCIPSFKNPDTCTQPPSIDFRLTEPRFLDLNFTNRTFGSSITFVGNGGDTVAASAGGGGYSIPYVHVSYKPPGSDIWGHLTTLDPLSEETSSSNFSLSVGASKEGFIVIGAFFQNIDANESGRVYVYEPQNNMTKWIQVAILSPDSTADEASQFSPSFGSKVLIDDNSTVVVSSVGDGNGTGSVYVYERGSDSSDWIQVAKLQPEASDVGARFGSDIAFYDNLLAIGATRSGMGGAVFLYYSSIPGSWQLLSQVSPLDLTPDEGFGSALALGSCTLAVASLNTINDPFVNTADKIATRIFSSDANRTSWFQTQNIEPENQIPDLSSTCMAMDSGTLLIGAPNARATYQFDLVDGTWTEKRVFGPAFVLEDEFGCGLALSGNTAIVGARRDSSIGESSGSAFVYDLCPDVALFK